MHLVGGGGGGGGLCFEPIGLFLCSLFKFFFFLGFCLQVIFIASHWNPSIPLSFHPLAIYNDDFERGKTGKNATCEVKNV